MIIVDTNVISELVRQRPSESVVHWFRRFGPMLALPTTVIAEMYHGLELIKDREREASVRVRYDQFLVQLSQRILPFDSPAALEYARIAAHCKRVGAEIQVMDGQTAAIARVRRARVATRDFKDFRETGVKLINPWEE